MISLSLLSFCLISLVGVGKSILSSRNIAKKKINKNKTVFKTKLLFNMFLFGLGFNLSCIIIKLYLNLTNKTYL